MRNALVLRRGLLLAAASVVGLAVAAPAAAQAVTGSVESPGIIVRNDLNPTALPPSGVLDSGINGVGQMTVRSNPTTTGMTVCTGTLINPRTVIFAAHCVNGRPAEAYGANGVAFGPHAGGTPIAFGFGADNLPAVRQWLGLDGGTAGATNLARALYAVEQVWYDPRSRAPASCTSATSCFLQADVAIATLDTPAFDIPAWAMLFTPLDGPTHATITGYGNRGNAGSPTAALGIDWRRRSAENMISLLGSFNDRNMWIFGSGGILNNLYMSSFSDPAGIANYNPAAGNFDFGIFGDSALPREGTTAGGDSGGPLIVDQRYDIPVVAGVLSGGSRFFAAQAGHNYGTHDFYQPLHAYWDVIVANNPYVYAGNKGGEGDWEDPNHWVQLMDPAYMIDVGGDLVNSLPGTAAEGISGTGAKFGQVCFLSDCTTLNQDAPAGSGTPIFIAGGPGSTMFVPNNVVADPAEGVKARYYDVTLAAAGTTNLSSDITVDRMALNGQTRLNIATAGSLGVLGEYSQFQGWTNVDGSLSTGGDMLVLSGLLSGNGTVSAPFVTVIGGIVAPGGGDRVGTLTVDGNFILASASSLFVDAQQGGADQLVVIGGAGSGALDVAGSVVFNKVTDAPAPRHGESYVIATATGGVTGTFGGAYTFQGVLRPELAYGANSITATLRAGSLVEILDGSSATEIAFASALDSLRTANYTSLWNLYGSIDWMNGSQLSATFASLTPRILGDVGALHDRQSKLLMTSVSDRLSLLASGRAKGLTMVGNLTAAFAAQSQGVQSGQLGFGASNGGSVTVADLPGRMTGFMSGGVDRTRSSYGGDQLTASQGGWHMAMGLEMPLGDNGAFGTATGFAEGESSPNGDHNRSRTMMAAAYAAMPLGDGFYVGGLVSAESSRASLDRNSTDGNVLLRLSGATSATRYSAVAEAGFAAGIGHGLMLTPRAQLGYSHYSLDGFTEEGGETALKLDGVRVSRVEARLGAKLEGKARLAGVAVVPQLSADYVSLLSGRETGATVRFAVAPDEAIHLPLSSAGSGWAEFKGGVTFGDGPLTLGLSGQHATGGAMTDQRAQADIRFRW